MGKSTTPTIWVTRTTEYTLVRLEAQPPVKSPAPQEMADARPKKIVISSTGIILTSPDYFGIHIG
jgi:hypothetical protein